MPLILRGKPSASVLLLVAMASHRAFAASASSAHRLAFSLGTAARPAAARQALSHQHAPRLALAAGAAAGRAQGLGAAGHVCRPTQNVFAGVRGAAPCGPERRGMRALKMSAGVATEVEELTVDLLSVEGRIATLKVREDGQGTMLQGLAVQFGGGMTGTVVWQRTPLIFVLVNGGEGGAAGLGDKATIPLQANVTVATGPELVGRVVDFRGLPIDGGAPVSASASRAMFGMPTLQRDMATISKPLHTGISGVDCLTPIGRGQNMLVIGTLDSGRRALALDAVETCGREGVSVVYVCLQSDHTAIVKQLSDRGCMANATVVAAGGRDHGFSGAAECVSAAATGCAIAEDIRQRGGDVLVVLDDIETHRVFWEHTERVLIDTFGAGAVAGNSTALNAASSEMRAFYSSLLQRVGYLNTKAGGGSLSMLVLVEYDDETAAGGEKEAYTMKDFDHPVYGQKLRDRLQLMVDRGIALTPAVLKKLSIPPPEVQTGAGRFELMRVEELMSMSDGQVFLSARGAAGGGGRLSGITPPIDVRTSLTRVGIGHDSLAVSSSPAMRAVASRLRFELAQASDIPKDDQSPMAKKQRARALGWQAAMQQPYGAPRTLSETIIALYAASKGYLDGLFGDAGEGFAGAVGEVGGCVAHVHKTCPEAVTELNATKDWNFKTKEAVTAALDAYFKK